MKILITFFVQKPINLIVFIHTIQYFQESILYLSSYFLNRGFNTHILNTFIFSDSNKEKFNSDLWILHIVLWLVDILQIYICTLIDYTHTFIYFYT